MNQHRTLLPLMDSYINEQSFASASSSKMPLLPSADNLLGQRQQLLSLQSRAGLTGPPGYQSNRGMDALGQSFSGVSQDDMMKLFSVMLNSASEVLSQQQKTELTSKVRADVFSNHRQRTPYSYQKPKMLSKEEEVSPSKVVHCRAVADGSTEADLIQVMKPFGDIEAITIMPKIRQALVEYKDLDSAIACVTFAAANPIILLERQLFLSYSKSASINRSFTGSSSGTEQEPSATLLFTVINALQPVNVETIKKITAPHAPVQRIVFFHKNGLQAMVEFLNEDDAAKVQEALNGYDIFTGCCTLKIDFARAGRLRVHANTEESFDIDLPTRSVREQPRRSAHDNLKDLFLEGPASSPTVQNIIAKVLANQAQSSNPFFSMMQPTDDLGIGNVSALMSSTNTGLRMAAEGGDGCVCMVYGLDKDIFNCARVFNLFCLYGNIVKIKMFAEKPGMAMVQYTDSRSTSLSIQYLSNLPLFGNKISMQISKHPYIVDPKEVHELFDGSKSTLSFLESKNNRFRMQPGGTDPMKRIMPPSKVIHYFNAPPDVSDVQLHTCLSDSGAELPLKMAQFNKANARNASGLMQFESIKMAMEALILANHQVIRKGSEVEGQAFTLKLAFSPSDTINSY